jgi:hypothetical protein
MSDGVDVVYVDQATLLGRRDEVQHELAQIRSMRTERHCLDELDQIAFLLGEDGTVQGGLMGDAETLERAAQILQARTTKPAAISLTAFCRVLLQTAAKIRAEELG